MAKLPLLTTRGTVHFSCDVTHPKALKDVYVFVSNSRGHGYRRKVFYRAARGKKQVHLEGDVELPAGANSIIVMARATNQLSSFRLLRVFRATADQTSRERKQ